MKIGFVSCEYPPFRGGGIGTYTNNMTRLLVEAGHTVHVIANAWPDYVLPGQEQPPALERRGNLWIHRIDAITKAYEPRPPHNQHDSRLGQMCRIWESSLYWTTLAAEKLAEVCREHHLDVVEYPECYAEAYMPLRRRNLEGGDLDVPTTITLHSPIYEITHYNLYRKYEAWFERRNMMEEYCIRHADMLSCPSAALVGMVQERLGLDPAENPCEVIYNPMDFEPLADGGPAVAAEDPARPTLLFVGRIEPRKGVKYLIDAALEVMPKHPGLTVHLIGKDCDAGEVPGSMVDFMKRRIPDEFADRFVFEGLRPRDEVLKRYAAATACVFAAPWDNLPYTCCEAMAYGGCVIAADKGGFAEMIEHEQSGLLFPTTNVPVLAASIERALGDPALRAKLRKNAAPRIRDVCDPAKAVRKREAHYRYTIERHAERKARRLSRRVSLPGKKLALFIPNHSGVDAIVKTIDSVRVAADKAGFEVDISVIGTRTHNQWFPPDLGVHHANTGRDDDNSALAAWLRRMPEVQPDYLMTMWPWDELAPDYFTEVRQTFGLMDKVGWATSWAESVPAGMQEPYVGYDFAVPLELLYYHAVPLAMIRYDAFQAVGGWNLELPAGWRQWDLWLALHQAGWHGLVTPKWLARYIPYGGIRPQEPLHAKAHELILEAIVERNDKLFQQYGGMFLIRRASDRTPQTAELMAAARGLVENGRKSLLTRVRNLAGKVRRAAGP